MNTRNRHIVIVTYSYWPFIDPRAFRWTKLAEGFVARGHTVDVVAAWRPGVKREETVNGVKIHRTGGHVLERLRPILGGTTVTSPTPGKSEAPTGKLRPSLMRRLHDLTWKKLHWPDFASLWRRSASRELARILSQNSVDSVYTVSVPFTSHLVFQSLRLRYPQVRWIADNGDPFSFSAGAPPNNLYLYDRRNVAAERAICAGCDIFSVTTEATKAEYARRFPESAHKMTVIGPLLSTPLSNSPAALYFPADETLRLLYVGTLYRNLRNPTFLLELFATARLALPATRLELHFMGALKDCDSIVAAYAERLGESLVIHGMVDRAVVAAAMQSATVLVNIGNDNPHQLPSKVVDYVATGRPIINIAKPPDDSSHAFFAPYPAYRFFRDTGERPTEEAISSFVAFLQHLPPAVDISVRNAVLAPYTADVIISAYERLAFPPPDSKGTSLLKSGEAR